MKAETRTAVGLAVIFLFPSAVPAASLEHVSWNPKAAAEYLDQRAQWWMSWPGAARDRGTFCISCHTALPYALSRSALGATLGDRGPSPEQLRILSNVTSVCGSGMKLSHPTTNKSALIRLNSPRNGIRTQRADPGDVRCTERQAQRGDARRVPKYVAFATDDRKRSRRLAMAQLRERAFRGQRLGFLRSLFSGRRRGHGSWRLSPGNPGNEKSLRDYLNREYVRQSLSNQAVLLWASARLPGLLTAKQQALIADELVGKQQVDGGWSLSSLAWTWRGSSPKWLAKLWIRSEGSPFQGKSDGYATGMVAYALEQYGIPGDNADLARALDWLRRNQSQTEGRWPGYSLNHAHEQSATGLFMSDAATAYAVLALTGSGARP